MRIVVLHDEAGKIIAASRVRGDRSPPVPVATEQGHSVVELDLPADLHSIAVGELCAKYDVHELKDRGAKSSSR